MVIEHNERKSYEVIPRLVAMADLTVCFWDTWFCSSTWKLIVIEESLKVTKRTIDPIGKQGLRPSPVLILKMDEYREMAFSESYERQILWLEHPKKNEVLEQIVNLIGVNADDNLPYLKDEMLVLNN